MSESVICRSSRCDVWREDALIALCARAARRGSARARSYSNCQRTPYVGCTDAFAYRMPSTQLAMPDGGLCRQTPCQTVTQKPLGRYTASRDNEILNNKFRNSQQH